MPPGFRVEISVSHNRSCRFLPIPGRLWTVEMPCSVSSSVAPTPESINIFGVSRAPADKITSCFASTVALLLLFNRALLSRDELALLSHDLYTNSFLAFEQYLFNGGVCHDFQIVGRIGEKRNIGRGTVPVVGADLTDRKPNWIARVMIEIQGIFVVGNSLEKSVKSWFPVLCKADFERSNGSQLLSFSERNGGCYTLQSHVH